MARDLRRIVGHHMKYQWFSTEYMQLISSITDEGYSIKIRGAMGVLILTLKSPLGLELSSRTIMEQYIPGYPGNGLLIPMHTISPTFHARRRLLQEVNSFLEYIRTKERNGQKNSKNNEH
jgi:hypothetical protein